MNIFTKLTSFFNTQKPETQEPNKDSVSITISKHLTDFLENEVLDGLDISKDHFLSSFEKIINEFSPRNKALLQKREDIQTQIDNWHLERQNQDFNQVVIHFRRRSRGSYDLVNEIGRAHV